MRARGICGLFVALAFVWQGCRAQCGALPSDSGMPAPVAPPAQQTNCDTCDDGRGTVTFFRRADYEALGENEVVPDDKLVGRLVQSCSCFWASVNQGGKLVEVSREALETAIDAEQRACDCLLERRDGWPDHGRVFDHGSGQPFGSTGALRAGGSRDLPVQVLINRSKREPADNQGMQALAHQGQRPARVSRSWLGKRLSASARSGGMAAALGNHQLVVAWRSPMRFHPPCLALVVLAASAARARVREAHRTFPFIEY